MSPATSLRRDNFEARDRIFRERGRLDEAIKANWRRCADGIISFDEAGKIEASLRAQSPVPAPNPMRPLTEPQIGSLPYAAAANRKRVSDLLDAPQSAAAPKSKPARSRPTAEHREGFRRQAYSGPLPPALACKFTPAALAVLNVIGNEIAARGDCRLSVKELAARSSTSRRTVQYALRDAHLRALIQVKRRRLTRLLSLPNVVVIISQDWLAWLARRGVWAPSRRRRLRPQSAAHAAATCGNTLPQIAAHAAASHREIRVQSAAHHRYRNLKQRDEEASRAKTAKPAYPDVQSSWKKWRTSFRTALGKALGGITCGSKK